MIDVTLLMGAVGTLGGVIGVLWRTLVVERTRNEEATRLIFALLGERANRQRESPPPTSSTPEKLEYTEAVDLATKAINGDIEQLVRDYLATDRHKLG